MLKIFLILLNFLFILMLFSCGCTFNKGEENKNDGENHTGGKSKFPPGSAFSKGSNGGSQTLSSPKAVQEQENFRNKVISSMNSPKAFMANVKANPKEFIQYVDNTLFEVFEKTSGFNRTDFQSVIDALRTKRGNNHFNDLKRTRSLRGLKEGEYGGFAVMMQDENTESAGVYRWEDRDEAGFNKNDYKIFYYNYQSFCNTDGVCIHGKFKIEIQDDNTVSVTTQDFLKIYLLKDNSTRNNSSIFVGSPQPSYTQSDFTVNSDNYLCEGNGGRSGKDKLDYLVGIRFYQLVYNEDNKATSGDVRIWNRDDCEEKEFDNETAGGFIDLKIFDLSGANKIKDNLAIDSSSN